MPPGEEDAAVSFYQGLLGVPRVPKPPNLAVRGGVWFETENVRIHLGVEVDFRPARKAHPAFVVEELGALVERLSEHGVSAEADEPLEGFVRVYATDPFGNRIELLEPRAGDEPSAIDPQL